MRLNAPITILLALMSLFPASTAFAAATRKAHQTAAAHKKATSTASAKERSARSRAVSTSRSKKVEVKSVRTANSTAGRRKATSADFIVAAKASPKRVSYAKGSRRRGRTAVKTDSVVAVARTQTPRKPEAETIAEEAATPILLPTIYNRRGRLIVPPPLKGSHEILVRQNVVADRDGLDRIQDDNDLLRMRGQGLLVAVPTSRALDVDDRLPIDRRYTRPWTAQFLTTLARAHYARFHSSIQVNSAVRTVEFQQKLIRTNGNAAPAEGETASPHLTGQAVDIAKHDLSRTEIAWMRGYFLPLIQEGRIDVEEEFQQSCFHISVYKKYVPSRNTPRREIAGRHGNGASALAVAVQ
jgi:hypothetical protein